MAFTGEGKLVGSKGNWLRTQNAEATLSRIAFAGCRSRVRGRHVYRTALLEYWGNILIFGATLYASWGYATCAGLVKHDISPEVPAAVCGRIIIGQFWYAPGALLCFFNTYLSMLVIISVQVFYILSLWLRLRSTSDAPTPPDTP